MDKKVIKPGRPRAHSTVSIKDYIERKRKITDPEELQRWEEEQKVFCKSAKIQRSPQKQQVDEVKKDNPEKGELEEMEPVLKKLDEIKAELKEESNKKHKDLMTEIRKVQEEFQAAKAEWKKRAEEWRQEKVELEARITKLENSIEKQEREKRRNKVVIKGISVEESQMEEKVEQQILKDKLKSSAKVKKAFSVKGNDNKQIIIVELNSWEEKQEVMNRKSLLKGTNIYIESDLTREEMKIQAELRKIMRTEKENGKKVKMGYQKLIIDDIRYDWDTTKQGIVKHQSKK